MPIRATDAAQKCPCPRVFGPAGSACDGHAVENLASGGLASAMLETTRWNSAAAAFDDNNGRPDGARETSAVEIEFSPDGFLIFRFGAQAFFPVQWQFRSLQCLPLRSGVARTVTGRRLSGRALCRVVRITGQVAVRVNPKCDDAKGSTGIPPSPESRLWIDSPMPNERALRALLACALRQGVNLDDLAAD